MNFATYSGAPLPTTRRWLSDEPMRPGEADRLCDDLEHSTYPQATDLIFNWRHKYKNAAAIVDYALGEEEKRS
ncbi:MAG TPA: hypothetical protein VGG01_23935 [Xanthobacteraceae bacterium]|jgi:hypothetical protein